MAFFSRQLLNPPKPTFSFLNCPPNLVKFTTLPFLRQKTLFASSCSMESPPEGYRKNVGICLINPSKKIFAASRLDIPDAWQMPQGGIDESEDPKIAASRELKEETGVTSAEVVAEAPHWVTYDFPPHVREKLKHQWGSDWKGQAQKWFLFKFTGKDEEINLLGDGSEKPEFGEWSWMSPEQVIDHAVDFKKPVYKEVLAAFTPFLQIEVSHVNCILPFQCILPVSCIHPTFVVRLLERGMNKATLMFHDNVVNFCTS